MKKSVHYYLLFAQPSRVRLFEGFRDHLFEIAENGFPVQCPSGIKEICVDQVNEAFGSFFRQEPLGVVLMGTEKLLRSLQAGFQYMDGLSGMSAFDGSIDDVAHFGAIAWDVVKAQLSGAPVRPEDLNDTRIVASGIYSVWDSVAHHNSGTLLVEEALQVRGVIHKTSDGAHVLHTPGAADIFDDAVDIMIDNMLSMGGHVQFCGKGDLAAYHGILLIDPTYDLDNSSSETL